MPRAPRIDIPGVLQHVIVRGVEWSDIFLDDADRSLFVQRLAMLLQETGTQCLAWSLMSNHFHLLVRPEREKLSSFMRRLLTGYAVTFNLRHRRTGHLFQNRYKSIVCEEEPYFLELVSYIHLNPLRAGLIADLGALDRYPWSGHSVLMGARTLAGQNVADVLASFGEGTQVARKAYRCFIRDGAGQGKREELVGGGLRRVQRSAAEEEPAVYDVRVLGSGAFVQRLIEDHEVCRPEISAVPLLALVRSVAEALGVDPDELRAPGRSKRIAEARSAISYVAYRKMGYSGDAVARELGITRSGVCRRAAAGEALVCEDERLRTIFKFSRQVTSVLSPRDDS